MPKRSEKSDLAKLALLIEKDKVNPRGEAEREGMALLNRRLFHSWLAQQPEWEELTLPGKFLLFKQKIIAIKDVAGLTTAAVTDLDLGQVGVKI